MSSDDCLQRSALLSSYTDEDKREFTSRYGDECVRQCCPNLSRPKRLSLIDRLLPVWILAAMAVGLVLGNFVPSTHTVLTGTRFAGVSIPMAVGLLVMMYPILCKIRYEDSVRILRQKGTVKNLLLSLAMNWTVGPFLMLGLSWAFLLDKRDLREGLIIVGLGRCIAMVMVWTQLAGGDSDLCAIIVAFNSLLQIVLISPMALLFLNVISSASGARTVSYSVAARSVGVFLGIPFGGAVLTRLLIRPKFQSFYDKRLMPAISPFTLIGLLFTIIIMFASQGRAVVTNIVSVLRVAAPLVVYFLLTFMITFFGLWKLGFSYATTCTQSFTMSSNNFELAIAVCAAVFGVNSQQALAATVGPLVEVPVLVLFVYFAKFVRPRIKWE